MHFSVFDKEQIPLFERIAKWAKKEFRAEPEAIIYRGSRTCTQDKDTDLDALLIYSDIEKRDELYEVGGYQVDISLMSPQELHKRITNIHDDSIERTSMMALSHIVWEGVVDTHINAMYHTIMKDFQRFIYASIKDDPVTYDLEDVLLYPLMLDLYRLPTIQEPARRFLESPYLESNLKQNEDSFKRYIQGQRFQHDYEDDNQLQPVPPIRQSPLRNFPHEYSLGMTHLPRNEGITQTDPYKKMLSHFMETKDGYKFIPRVKELLE
ncbi:MAG: hypothetical protein ACQESG_00820 [Nanobdellota archaeon]